MTNILGGRGGARGEEQHLGSSEQEDYVAGLIFPQVSPRGLGNVDKRVEVGLGAKHFLIHHIPGILRRKTQKREDVNFLTKRCKIRATELSGVG